ncbi:hypothetical protein D3C85_1085290 [compost metagenome]
MTVAESPINRLAISASTKAGMPVKEFTTRMISARARIISPQNASLKLFEIRNLPIIKELISSPIPQATIRLL